MIKRTILKIKHKKILEQFNNLTIKPIALIQYREDVRDNKFEDRITLRKKLKRNFLVGERLDDYTVQYGNLTIKHYENQITCVENSRGKNKGYEINQKLKRDLDYLLEL